MRDSSLGPLLAVFYGCGFLAGFNENLVNMALVAIMGDFSIDAVAAQWLVTGYMIAVTVVVTCMAYLYRRLSMRALFFAAAALSVAGSAGGFLAPNFLLLLVARLVQAVGTGMFIPLMMNVIVDRVPHERLGTYLAIGSAMITIGPATAPIVTGFMVSDLDWRSVFLVPLAAAVALMVVGIFVVRGGREPERARFDLPSALLTAAGVTLLCVGLSEVTLRPAVGAAALIGAALALGWFARRQEHLARPLVSMEPLHHGMFWPAALLVMVTMMTYFSLSVMAPLYFEEAAGLAASAAGVLSWMLTERITVGKCTLVGAATGLVAGLVVITPAAGFVEPWAAIVMGLIVSPIVYWAISQAKRRLGYDDALDAFGCHCVGGIVGGILTGLFCVPGLSWTGHGGLLYTGDWSLLGAQVLGILVTIAFVAIADVVLGLIIKACFAGSLRVSAEDEAAGLDVAVHGESAYPAYLGLD